MKKFGKKRNFERLSVDAYFGCRCPHYACNCGCNCVALPCECSFGVSYSVGLGYNSGVSYGASTTLYGNNDYTYGVASSSTSVRYRNF